ncbi:hypothetical protein QLX08_009176 [Tetragonisca angustula]|uniref:Uncharacterized protein n=1 Tax=Tetragonisca angustula TaxID=166442 RepID=A0AAW0ZH57_9HYME
MYKSWREGHGVPQTLDPLSSSLSLSLSLSLYAVVRPSPIHRLILRRAVSVVCSRCTHARARRDPRDQQQAVDVPFPPSGHPVPPYTRADGSFYCVRALGSRKPPVLCTPPVIGSFRSSFHLQLPSVPPLFLFLRLSLSPSRNDCIRFSVACSATKLEVPCRGHV